MSRDRGLDGGVGGLEGRWVTAAVFWGSHDTERMTVQAGGGGHPSVGLGLAVGDWGDVCWSTPGSAVPSLSGWHVAADE